MIRHCAWCGCFVGRKEPLSDDGGTHGICFSCSSRVLSKPNGLPPAERHKLWKRGWLRTHRHGNWRQTYVDCLGMCVWDAGDGVPCGEVRDLEFHELFREDHNGDGRLQQRVLVCCNHHNSIHDYRPYHTGYNPKPSRLAEDVALEMEVCGGYQGWVMRFGLVEATAGILLPGNMSYLSRGVQGELALS